MGSQQPTYFVCGACLALSHEDCANILEFGSCGCACRFRGPDHPRAAKTMADRSGDKT